MNENNNQIEELEPTLDSSTPNPVVQEESSVTNVEPVQPQPEPQIPSGMIDQVNKQEEPQIIASYDQGASTPQPIQQTPVEQTIQSEAVPTPVNNDVIEPPMENIEESSVTSSVPPIVENKENEVVSPMNTPQPTFSMEPDPNIKLDDEEEIENKKKQPKALIIGIGVLVLLGLLYFLYNSTFQNKKVIVQKEVTTVFDTLIGAIKEIDNKKLDIDFDKDKVGVEGSLNVSSNFKSTEMDLSKLKDYSLNYNGVLDKNNNKLSGSISLNKNNSKLLSADTYINGKTILLQSAEIYNKIIKTTMDKEIKEYDFNKTLETENITILLEKTKNIVKNSINEKNITKTSVTKEINGKKQSVNKVSYKLDLNQLEKDIMNGYLKDEECLKILSDISGEEVKDIKELINESLKYYGDEKEEILVDAYTDKFTSSLKLLEIVKELGGSKNSIVFSVTKNTDNYKFSLKATNEELLTGYYDKKKEELKVESSSDGARLEAVLREEKEDSYYLSINMAAENNRFSVEGTIDNKKTKESLENNTKVSINADIDGEKINADITSTYKISKSGTIKELNEASAIDMESIPDEDYNVIEGNLLEKVQKIIMDIMPGYFESINMRLTENF